jgi:phosphate/sulfate permease
MNTPVTKWLVVTSALLIGTATVAGAWLARRHAARRELCFGAAAGALLVIAGLHLLPDAWSAARQTAIPALAVPVAAIAAFAVTGFAIRRGCACRASLHHDRDDRRSRGPSPVAERYGIEVM